MSLFHSEAEGLEMREALPHGGCRVSPAKNRATEKSEILTRPHLTEKKSPARRECGVQP